MPSDFFLNYSTAVPCVCVVIPVILDVRLVDVPAGVTQEEGHTGFLIHLLSARRIQPFLSLLDREKSNFEYLRINRSPQQTIIAGLATV